MAIIKKFSPFQNLSNYQVFLNDDTPTSEYFRISEFNETFTGGKNGFLIEGTEHLKPTTEIKIEILDVAGNPVYFEPGEGIPEYYEGNSKLVSVHVYDDTPIGISKITILGELERYDSETTGITEIPQEWRGVYNVKWERTFNINKNLANETIVRFKKRPFIEIDELVKPIFSKTIPTATDTGTITGIPEIPNFGTDIRDWRAGTLYKLQRSSGSWDRDVDESRITISLDNGDTFAPTIIEVLNDNEVLVEQPYVLDNLVDSFVSQSYSVSYTDFANEIVGESTLTGSFAKINMTRLKTFVGDVARVKVFRKSRNTVGDFQFVQESKLESTELLRDVSTSSNTELSYGKFDESNLSTYWISSSDDHPLSINSDVLSQAVKVDYNILSGSTQKLITNESFELSKDVEYTLSFKTLLSGSFTPDNNIKAYFSGSYTNNLGNPATYTQSFLDITPDSSYQLRTNVSENILAEQDITASLVFEFTGDDWYISNASLKNAQETSFSPDEFILIQDIPRKLPAEIFDFRFEFYDINNNYIPVDVTAEKTFDGGNDFPTSGKLLTFESDRNAFRFSSGSEALPPFQQIQFKTTQNNLTGTITYASAAFDTNGNYIEPSSYGASYPGLLTGITPAGALLTVANFSGSIGSTTVGSIVYTASLDGLEEFETVYRLEDGDNAPQLIVTSNANQFIYEPTTLTPKPSGQNITIRAQRKNLASLVTPIEVNSGSNSPLTYVSTQGGIDTYTISATEFSSSFASDNFDEVTYSFTGSDIFGVPQSDEITISKVINFDAVSVVLSNESATFPAKSTGEVIGSFSGGDGTVQVLVGGSEIQHSQGLGKNTFDITAVSGTNVTPTSISPPTNSYGISAFPTASDTGNLNLTIVYEAGDAQPLSSGTQQTFTKIVNYTKAKKAVPIVLTKVSPSTQTINSGSTGFETPETIEVIVQEGGDEFAYDTALTSAQTFKINSLTVSAGSASFNDEVITLFTDDVGDGSGTLITNGINGSADISYKDSEGTQVDNKTVRYDLSVSKIGTDGAGAVSLNYFPQSQNLLIDIDGNYTPDPPLPISMSVVQGGSELSYVAYNTSIANTFSGSTSKYTLTNVSNGSIESNGHVQPNTPSANTPYFVGFDVTYIDEGGTISNTFPGEHYINIVADGSTGPGIVFTGPWDTNRTYQFDLSNGRRDAVLYDGRYYATLQSNTSQTPASGGTTYWQDLGTEDFFVAAEIAIFKESFIQNTLNVGNNNSGALSAANITLAGSTDHPYFSLGQSASTGSQGYAVGDGIFIGRDNSDFKMSLENSTSGKYLRWTGDELQIKGEISATSGNISGTVTIGGTDASDILFDGDAAGDVNNNTTTITGNKIRTGNLQSNSYTGVTDGSAFSTDGSNINLTDGTFTTPSFRINSNGDAFFAGDISSGATITGASISGGTITGTTFSGATGNFSGVITSTSGNIGGWTIANNEIYRQNEMSLNANRPALEIYDGSSVKVDINAATSLSSLGATSSGNLTVGGPPSSGNQQINTTGQQFNTQINDTGVITATYNAGTLNAGSTSGQTMTFGHSGVSTQSTSAQWNSPGSNTTSAAWMDLEHYSLSGNASTYTTSLVVASVNTFLELIDSGGNVVASISDTLGGGIVTALVGGSGGGSFQSAQAWVNNFNNGPRSTTFISNGGTYSVQARTVFDYNITVYVNQYGGGQQARYYSQMRVRTAEYNNVRIFKEVSKTEINGGGLQVVRSTTEFVKMDRQTSGTMLEVGGNITATGNITAYYSSDKRLKDNIIPIENPFEKIDKISGYEFEWKPEFEEIHNSKGNDVGVIAQEIKASMPELVGMMSGGYMGVKYEKLTVYLLEAVKNLNDRLIEVEEENKKLKENK